MSISRAISTVILLAIAFGAGLIFDDLIRPESALAQAKSPRLDTPRLAPLAESEWNEDQQRVLEGIAQLQGGRLINIFPTLAHNPKLLERWLTFGSYVLRESTLPAREREILILRIGWLCQAKYEFGQHTVIGKQAGLSDADVKRITEGPDADGWSDEDRLLLRATDELHGDAFISDGTWKGLAGQYTNEQLVDIVFTVGQYNLVSMALNTLGVQLDEGVPGFPE